MICLGAKLHFSSSFSASLAVTMKPKVKYFLTAVTLLYVLQEYYLDKICIFFYRVCYSSVQLALCVLKQQVVKAYVRESEGTALNLSLPPYQRVVCGS